MHAKPFEDGRQVVAHRALADKELVGDRSYALAAHQVAQDFPLPGAQGAQLREAHGLGQMLDAEQDAGGIDDPAIVAKLDDQGHDHGVKFATGPASELVNGPCRAHRSGPVRARAGQGVKLTSDGDDASQEGDLVTLQAVGITGAVPSLMVSPDRGCDRRQGR